MGHFCSQLFGEPISCDAGFVSINTTIINLYRCLVQLEQAVNVKCFNMKTDIRLGAQWYRAGRSTILLLDVLHAAVTSPVQGSLCW